MKKALIVIDYTVDFVAENGALTCGEAGQILEKAILRHIRQFIDEDELIIFVCDLHEKNDPFHPETKLFPPHNIRNTKGRELYNEVQSLYEEIKHLPNVIWMDKTRYSSFAGTNLEQLLRERNINELYLTGVCSDICVLHTAVDAYNKSFDLVIYEDSVASFNQAGHEWALGHFKNSLGATIM
ncbi:cysteine hydrolase family protein [Rummeliibacillus sp. NPDC094406]|uniref:cysteine hydrolase family protein n=1 Tax=Rummeliibacillus sp. NPDC094406 TaxID=3364511 RepID=UPI00380972CF